MRTASPSASGKVRLPVAVDAGVLAAPQRHGDRARVGDRDRAVGERVRRDRHEQDRRHMRMHDRSRRGQRVRGGAGRRGDDQSVGTHCVHEHAVDLHGEVDHAALRAAACDDLVQRDRRAVVAAGAPDRRLQQRAALLDVAAREHRRERVLHRRERDVGEEAEPALVHADQRDVVAREAPRDGQHRSVAADDDGDVDAGAEVGCRRGRVTGQRRVGGRFGFEHDLVAPLGEKFGELHERFGDAGARVAADQRDAAKPDFRRGAGHRAIKAHRGCGFASRRTVEDADSGPCTVK